MNTKYDCCEKEVGILRGWWLNNYFGFNGHWCSDCYDKIAHNSYGKPNDPEAYLLMCLKLGKDSTGDNYEND